MERNTIQRLIIYNTVTSMCNHPSAEMVYDKVRGQYPDIGRSTVFRQLKTLAEEGKIQRIAMTGTADRYDFSLAPHSHIVCRCCERVEDVSFMDFEVVSQPAENLSGFEIEDCDVIYRGVCPECRAKTIDLKGEQNEGVKRL